MPGRQTTPDPPFWIDDVNAFAASPPGGRDITFWLRSLKTAFVYAMRLAVIAVFVLLARTFAWAWICVALEVTILAALIYARILANSPRLSAPRIQRAALETTGASRIGSALHTAGHPLLQVDQPVVLALKEGELSIYSYASSVPLDSIQVKDLTKVETVVYDEDRIPHVGVADNTAQALQLSFPWRGHICTCVFRRMHNVSPIEWYQAIQSARLTG